MRNAELKWKVAYELRLAPLFRVPPDPDGLTNAPPNHVVARASECAEQREDVSPQGAGREARVAQTDEARPDHGECDTPGLGARRMLAQPGRRDAPGEDGLERHEDDRAGNGGEPERRDPGPEMQRQE